MSLTHTTVADLRGLEVVSIALQSVTLPEEDAEMIKNLQRQAVYRNAGMAGATLVEAQAEAMKGAANNPNGAMMGFMGLNMANMAAGNGGANTAANLINQDAQQQAAAQQQQAAAAVAVGSWKCPACGHIEHGRQTVIVILAHSFCLSTY